MIKRNKLKIIISTLITLLPMVFGLILWNKLPEQLATNFGFNGEVNSYGSKLFVVIGIPLILTFLHLFCIFVVMADPKRNNIINSAFNIIYIIVPFCSLLSSTMIYTNALGVNLSVEIITPALIGVLFLILGFMIPKLKQNYTVGIKLPWTLNDEENWDKTHALASPMWIVGGILMIISALLKLFAVYFAIIIIIAVVPVVYSYLLYKKSLK